MTHRACAAARHSLRLSPDLIVQIPIAGTAHYAKQPGLHSLPRHARQAGAVGGVLCKHGRPMELQQKMRWVLHPSGECPSPQLIWQIRSMVYQLHQQGDLDQVSLAVQASLMQGNKDLLVRSCSAKGLTVRMRGFSPASCGLASGSDCLSGDTLTLCARSSWSPSLLNLPRALPATCTCWAHY